MVRNQDVRDAMRNAKVFVWQVAECMGIHENTLYRYLRKPLKEVDKRQILTIIEQLKQKA